MTNFMYTTSAQLMTLNAEMKKCTEVKTASYQAHIPRMRSEEFDEEAVEEETNSYAKVATTGTKVPSRSGQPQEPAFQPVGRPRRSGRVDVTPALANQIKSGQTNDKAKQKGRNVFHGNSKVVGDEASQETFLAADVTLVASGLGLRAKEEELEAFLKDKGIDVVKVECLTKKEVLDANKVRSKTMKVVLSAKDHQKAMNPDIWPFRVGVRYYRAERRPGIGGLRRNSQSAESGGLTSQQEELDGPLSQGQDGPQSRAPPGSREWSNRRNQGGRQRQDQGDVALRNLYQVLGNQELLRSLGFSQGP